MPELKSKLIAYAEKSDWGLLNEDEVSRIQLPCLRDQEAHKKPNVLFVFTGQGSQWAGCGRDLYDSEIVFRRVVDAIDKEWLKLSGCTLSDVAFNEYAGDKINECCWAQPVTFLLQVAMFELFISHGIYPSLVIGHSAGEVSAAYASGAYSLAEACFLVYHRSRLQTSLEGCGRMLVLMLNSRDVEKMIGRLGFAGQVEIACYNSESNTVICGAEDTIIQLREQLHANGQLNGVLIPGKIAFHSQHMLPIRDELIEILSQLDSTQPRCGKIPMISTVHGSHIKYFDAKYWWRNVRDPVDLIRAMAAADKNFRPEAIIEVSPHITLRSPIREFYTCTNKAMPKYIYSLVRKSNTAEMFAEALGKCFVTGMPLNLRSRFPRPFPVTHLFPRYYMTREHVLDIALDEKVLTKKGFHSFGPLLGNAISTDHLNFECVFSKRHFAWMIDHVVQGEPLVPAAGYLEIIFEAFKGKIVHIETARFVAPFILSDKPKMMYAEFVPSQYSPLRYEYKIYSREIVNEPADTTFHCVGAVQVVDEKLIHSLVPLNIPRNIVDDTSNYNEVLYKSQHDFYSNMSARISHSFDYGPLFQGIQQVTMDKKNRDTRLDVKINPILWKAWDRMGYQFHPSMLDAGYQFHPSMLDAALQSFLVYVMEASDFSGIPQMVKNLVFISKPTSESMIVIYKPPEYLLGFHQKGQLAFGLGERSAGRIAIYDGLTGALCCAIGDYTSFTSNSRASDSRHVKHCLSWQPKDDVRAENIAVNAISSLKSKSDVGAAINIVIKDIISKAHPHLGSAFFLNVAECIIGAIPQRLALEDCISSLTNAPVQFTVLCGDKIFLTEIYQRFGTSTMDANLRFARIKNDFSDGFLRPSMFEFFIIRLHFDDEQNGGSARNLIDCEEFKSVSHLAAPGSLILIESNKEDVRLPTSDWKCLWKSSPSEEASSFMLFKAPPFMPSKPASASSKAIVVNDSLGFAEYWKAEICNEVSAHINFEQSKSWERVDYFAMQEMREDAIFDGPSKLAEFVKQMTIYRAGAKRIVPCLFTIYTSGAVNSVTSPEQSGIWGAARSLSLEIGESCFIDFHLLDVATKEDLWFASTCEAMRERELCVHNGRLWACRLKNNREAMPLASVSSEDKDSFRLITNNSGQIADIEFRLKELPTLKPNEIEISVKASALNFRDIMIGIGKLPLLSFESSMLGRTVGMECSGVVVRCGSEVQNFNIGDKVLAMQGGCIANRIACNKNAVYKMPSSLTFEEGSAIVSVYVTAYYALIYLARMREGQTILVHSALGGVGQAAIALAKLYGAKVYGTAGSEDKRQVLREMGCIDAFDSHSTQWYSDLMVSTNGCGVDIVLNSLAGEHLDFCLEALAPGGMHCEIGKVDIFADRPMRMSVFRKNIAFRVVDIDRLMTDDPQLTRELCGECLKIIEDGKVPALPCKVYSYNDYHNALRYMMNGQHRGKLVLVPPGPSETISAVDDRKLFGSGVDGRPRTILMSGCLGGFGLRVLSYVIALGARNIVLLDRDHARKRTKEWVIDAIGLNLLMGKVGGLHLEIVYGNVGVYEHVVDAVASVERFGMPPIGSVFHLAGILDDKKLENMDRDSFEKVFQPKANGAWNLHRATLDCSTIDHFIMFSSTSSVFGNPGQINYSAANSFQDGLAAMRLQSGKPALSFCMGAVVEAGMASRNTQLLQMIKSGGMPAISCMSAIEALDSAIRRRSHWNAVAVFAKDLPPNYESADFLRTSAQLIRNNAAFKMGGCANLSKEALVAILSERVGKLCGVEKIVPTEPFSSYGLNSISVAELATFLKNEMSYTASAMQLMTSATCESMADGILKAQTTSSAQSKSNDVDNETGETEAESDSGLDCDQEDDSSRADAISWQQSLFEPSIEEHFLNSGKADAQVGVVSQRFENLGFVDGKLPRPCQDALNELTSFIDSVDVSKVSASISVKEINRVMVTGATGFVGRHFIADLLSNQETYIETVYCPIRAVSDEAAMERLVEAMEESGTWRAEFAGRLHAFKADITFSLFGLLPDIYNDLCEKVEAIFHFASNLNLTAGFQDLCENNCSTMRSVFQLCLSVRRKHLFLSSTLGIFPQYFCQFTNEMADKPIHRNVMPEIALMKRLFPLNFAGYPWSKLVTELACYWAMKTKGLDLAIFRLPVMSTNSKTGFSVDGDPIVRMFYAVLQVRLVPGKLSAPFAEDSALSNEMMLRISLNPNRKNTIYHCSYMPHTFEMESPILEMMGYPSQITTYEKFKSHCLQMGSQSALHSFWILLDRFAPYWYSYKKNHFPYPIDISTVEEDCKPMPIRTNAMQVCCKGIEWSLNNPNSLMLDVGLLQPSTDLDSILEPSRKVCKMYNLDFDEVINPFAIEGLKRICAELHARKPILPEVVFFLTTRLEARVHLYRMVKMHPGIKDEVIQSPLFILGLHRTGTTFLQRMLEASGRFQAPHVEDQTAIPKPELIVHPDEAFAKNRLAAIASQLKALDLDGIHDLELGVAEEDFIAHATSFMSMDFDVIWDLPKYREWLETQNLDEVYKEHHTWMQFIAWWRHRQNPEGPSRWCYKYPWHIRSVKELLKEYPDARIVHTHRDIKEVAASWCSLVESQRKRFLDDVNVCQLGQDQIKSLGKRLQASYDFRKKHPMLEEKWIDVDYNQLIATPVQVAKQVIEHAGLEVDHMTSSRLLEFCKQSKAQRQLATFHRPKLEAYGISYQDCETPVFRRMHSILNNKKINKLKLELDNANTTECHSHNLALHKEIPQRINKENAKPEIITVDFKNIPRCVG